MRSLNIKFVNLKHYFLFILFTMTILLCKYQSECVAICHVPHVPRLQKLIFILFYLFIKSST